MANVPLVDLRAQYEPIKDEIHQAWDEILASMRLFLGPNVQAFEKEFAAFCGAADAIGISDGTTAIHLALRACGIGAGDEVISVSHTFIATFEAIALVGARPVFVDIDPKTYLMDVSQIEAKITPRTKAILPVHLYGQCVDMDPLMAIAKKHNLVVIEDACQAHGAEYKGMKAGSIGTLGCFSFYFSKNLGAYGEGGMVTTNDLALAKKVRMLRDHGSEKRYYHDEIGINGRLDEMQAAVLRIKLRRLAGWNEQRRANAALFNQLLAGSGVVTPHEAPGCKAIYHLYVIRTARRDALRDHLNAQGIGTGIHYPVPIHLQKAAAFMGYKEGDFPVTEKAVTEILSLPMYAELTAEQVKTVADEIKKFMAS
jgi:dTDP-4-amino-4,6-dideoxygalactose transaminase